MVVEIVPPFSYPRRSATALRVENSLLPGGALEVRLCGCLGDVSGQWPIHGKLRFHFKTTSLKDTNNLYNSIDNNRWIHRL